MADLSFGPARTAALSMDFHASIVSVYVKDECLMQRAADVLNRARSAGMTIIHVRVGFRPNLPEISPRNLLFGAIKNSPQWQKMFESDAAKLHPSVAPAGDDIVIT
jgi:nicotinamidase-related amidase